MSSSSFRLILGGVAIAALASIWGCAAPALEVGKDALRPPPRVVSYELEVHPRYSVVEVLFRQPGPAPLELTMTPWQNADFTKNIYDVHARLAHSGRRLPVARTSSHSWTVSSISGKDFIVRYVVVGHRSGLVPVEGQTDSEVATYTGPTQFLAWGRGLFLVPKQGGPDWDDIQLDVRAAIPNWDIRTSWGRRTNSFRNFEDLKRGLLLAGRWKTDETQMQNSHLQVSITGQWKHPPREIQRLVRRLLRVQSEIFGGYPRNAGLIALIPTADRARVLATPGGAVFYLPADVELDGDPDLVKDLALEHFKVWSGQLFAPRLDTDPTGPYREGHAKWFTSGLSEYYAVRTMMGMGVLETGDFIPILNAWIKDYFGNPYSFNTPLAVSLAGYAQNPAIQRLMRVKGALMGLIIDMELRAGSQGLKTLDHLMQKMLRRFADNDAGFSNQDVREMLEELTKSSWEGFFADHVEGTKILPLADLYRGGLIVIDQPLAIFDLGFRTSGAAATNVPIVAVTAGSEAEKAGVRVGDIVRAIKLREGRVDRPVRVTLERSGSKRPVKVKYLPTRLVEMPLATEVTGLFEDWFSP